MDRFVRGVRVRFGNHSVEVPGSASGAATIFATKRKLSAKFRLVTRTDPPRNPFIHKKLFIEKQQTKSFPVSLNFYKFSPESVGQVPK